MDLSQALKMWIEVSGVDPSRNSWTWGNFGDAGIVSLHRAIAEALELDDSETTGKMLFDFAVSHYLAERTFTAEELLDDAPRVVAYLGKCRDLRSYLRSPEVQGCAKDFSDRMREAVRKYGADNEDVLAIIADRHKLALLRRDAMRTIKHLEVHQFLDGPGEAPGTPPAYGKYVYRWNNVSSLLRSMLSAPSGVTLNLVSEEKGDYGCFFAFAIRNGSKLFVFTDREKLAHPLAAELHRRPDKILASRASRHWFPYELAGLKFNDEGKAYLEEGMSTSLVTYQAQTFPIKPISELGPETIVWLTMVLDLLVDKFWRQGFQAPALSYTADMIKVDSPVLEAAKAANIVVANYQELRLNELKVEDVTSEGIRNTEQNFEVNTENTWLEERYKHLVSDDSLNIITSADKKFIKRLAGPLQLGAIEAVDKETRIEGSITESANAVELDKMSPLAFATGEQLERDRLFIARGNYATQIDFFATKEFEERRAEITAWVNSKIRANLENLIPLVQFDSLYVDCEDLDGTGASIRYGRRKGTRREFMERVSLVGTNEWRRNNLTHLHGHGAILFKGRDWKKGCASCFMTGAASAWLATFVPETIEDLAWLCGVETSELPDVLQHWTRIDRPRGNHITGREDPMAWKCSNPWNDLSFYTSFFVSANAMKTIARQHDKAKISVFPPGFDKAKDYHS